MARKQFKVCEIRGDHGGAVAAGRQPNEGIVLNIPSPVSIPPVRIAALLDQPARPTAVPPRIILDGAGAEQPVCARGFGES